MEDVTLFAMQGHVEALILGFHAHAKTTQRQFDELQQCEAYGQGTTDRHHHGRELPQTR